MKFIDPTRMDCVYRVVDGEVEVYYDRSITSQDNVNVKYGSDGGVTHLTTGSSLTSYKNAEIVAQYTFTNDAKENKYGTAV